MKLDGLVQRSFRFLVWGGGGLVGWLVGGGFSAVFGLLASGFHGLRVAQRIEHNSRIASSTVHEP